MMSHTTKNIIEYFDGKLKLTSITFLTYRKCTSPLVNMMSHTTKNTCIHSANTGTRLVGSQGRILPCGPRMVIPGLGVIHSILVNQD